MRKFIFNIGSFLLPIIIFMFFADWSFSSRLRQSRDGEFSVWNDIYDSRVNAEVVIYGSSRAMVHMDPKIIRDSLNVDVYNLGINGHNFWLQYLRHQELLKNNRPPKFIIHSVDVFTLVKRHDLFQMEQFLPYMLYNQNMERWIESYDGYSKFDFYVPLIRYYGQYKTIGKLLRTTFNNSLVDSGRYLGFSSQTLSWNDDLVRARKKFPDFKIQIDTASLALFDKYLKECRDSGIAVVLIYTPEFIEGQDFVKNRSEILGNFRMFADKYNIPFLDYSDDSISYKKEYFYNASHLNGSGAEIFTSKMIHDIKINVTMAHYFQSMLDEHVHQVSYTRPPDGI